MALLDDLLKGETAKGLAIGLGVAILAPVALAALSGVGRPLARAVIKSGILLYEKGRETVAEFGEVVEDLVAEARAELQEAHAASASAANAAEEAVSRAHATEPPPATGE
jgi:Protein of unknown function (DUF5132)